MPKTVGQILLDEALPPRLRGRDRVLDKKGLKQLAEELAELGPDAYRQSFHRLQQEAAKVAFASGGHSPGLDDLIAPDGVEAARRAFRNAVTAVLADPKLGPAAREKALLAAVEHHRPRLDAALAEHVTDANAFARQVRSTAKGSPDNLRSILAGDLLYSDPSFRPVPVPVLRSFGEGVETHEYLAGVSGARLGLVTLKLGTAKGGWAAKRIANATHRLVVTDPDGPEPDPTHGPRGLPVPVTDPDNEGARLAHPAGGHPRNALLTPAVLADLAGKGLSTILVRSPVVGGPPSGGVYGYDVGVRDRGPAYRGEHAGLNAAQALCLADDTEVRMADLTARKIRDVWPGEYVYGADAAGVVRPVKVLANHDSGGKWCVETRLRLVGRPGPHTALPAVVSTADHRALLAYAAGDDPAVVPLGEAGQWRSTGAYRRRPRCVAVAPRGYDPGPDPIALTPEEARTYGSLCLAEPLVAAENAGLPPLLARFSHETAAHFAAGVLATASCDLVAGRPARYRLSSGSKRLVDGLAAWFELRYGLPVPERRRWNGKWILAYGGKTVGAVFDALRDGRVPDHRPRIDRATAGREDAGYRPCRDLEVDHPDHLFLLANGVITHNSEPMTQTLISSKHSGGVAGGTRGQEGFPVLDRLISIPENAPGTATHARADGSVESVAPAPQGGHVVTVAGEAHYVGPDRRVSVKPGDRVEAGDPLSDGVVRPDEVVAHKGVGEGRRRFVEAFMGAAKAAGFRPHRRNLELLARGLIDHVELHDEIGPHVPGDVVSYTDLEHHWVPRPGAAEKSPADALDRHLERPVLHYSLGDKIRPSVVKELQAHGVKSVLVHHEPPPFKPVMLRSHDVLSADPDFLTRTLGTHMTKSLLLGAERGDVTDPGGTSWVPLVAEGRQLGRAGTAIAPAGTAASKPPALKTPAPRAP